MPALDQLITKLRLIGAHVIVERLFGTSNYAVDRAAAQLAHNAYEAGAFDGPAFNSFRPGRSMLASLTCWLERNGCDDVFAELPTPQGQRIAAHLERIAKREHLAEQAVPLTQNERTILEALDKAPTTLKHYDFPLSRGTVSTTLKRLRNAGLTHRPKGKNSGEAITPKGRRAIQKKD